MKKAFEIGAMLLLAVGFVIVIGSVGNIEFADATGTVGLTDGQFWLRAIIGTVLMFTGVAIGNKVTR